MKNAKHTVGVILMTYGSATTADNVQEYFETIYGGKASRDLIHDFENRYRIVGGSPLIQITHEQARLLESKLNGGDGTGKGDARTGWHYVVRAGMRHSAPKIAKAVAECRALGAERLIGIVLSPQFSSVIMEGYRTAFLKAASENGFDEGEAVIAGPWPTESHFIELLARRTKEALAQLQKKHGYKVPVIFTTHSLPQKVVEKDPAYMNQLMETIDAAQLRLGDSVGEWYAGYQSAGHTPEAWLKPDLTDILDQIKEKAVLIVPIQFLADHLEILYDLDVAARQQCTERGIEYNRIEVPNIDPLFIDALTAVAQAAM